jgi:hypothetical protein
MWYPRILISQESWVLGFKKPSDPEILIAIMKGQNPKILGHLEIMES